MEPKKESLHVFIIPDGNRRWAKEKGFLPSEGHFKGQDVFRSIVREIWPLGATYLTIWTISKDNLQKRSKLEISILTEILEETFQELLSSEEVEKEKLRIRIIGRWREFFGKSFVEVAESLENKTAHYNEKHLTFLLAYNGDDEIRDALWRFKNNLLRCQNASLEELRKWSWTWFLPNVDIFIRTGFEPHLSNGALMLLMADSHLYFPQKHWPDFTVNDLKEIIDSFKNRQRRFGA